MAVTKNAAAKLNEKTAPKEAAVKTPAATKGAATPEPTEDTGDVPLTNNFAEAVKKLLKRGKERGYVTVDEMNGALPPERVSSEQIEDVLAQLSELGVNIVEAEDVEEEAEAKDSSEDYGRTDDPVRLYLREMGQVELLSREGEIAIAKRIEAGREMMINGICESPLTIQAILDWNDALKDGRLLLRDIVDLEAMQEGENGGPALPAEGVEDEAEPAEPADSAEGEGGAEGGADISGFDDEDNVSLAAVEEKLKPQIIEIFDSIASTYKKLAKAQHARMDALSKGETPDKKSDEKISTLKTELVDLVRTVRFNNARLEQLVQQLYTLNRRLMGLEGKMLRLGLDVGLNREEFLERYYGHELDPKFYDHILLVPPPPPPPAPKEPNRTHASILAAVTKPMTRAQAKAMEKERLKQEKEAKKLAAIAEKQAAKEAKAAAKQAAKEKEAAAKAAAAEAKAKLKIKQEAEKEKLRLKKEAERAKKEAQRERELAKKEAARRKKEEQRERELKKKLEKQKKLEKAKKEAAKKAAQKAKQAAQKAKAKKPKPATKKAKPVKKTAKKAPAKKPAAKKAKPAKSAVKKPAAKPARKTTNKSSKKSSAKKRR